MATVTVAYLVNTELLCNQPPQTHKLDNLVEAAVIADWQTIQPDLDEMIFKAYLKQLNWKTTAYIDIFVDGFLVLAQGTTHRQWNFCRTFFHTMENILKPLDAHNMHDQ